MSGVLEGLAGVVVIGVFAVLAWGGQIRRTNRRQRQSRSRAKTRPTIPHMAALPITREW